MKMVAGAGQSGTGVTTVDIAHSTCWGIEERMFMFAPDTARREGDAPQVADAIGRLRAAL